MFVQCSNNNFKMTKLRERGKHNLASTGTDLVIEVLLFFIPYKLKI